MTPSLDQSVVLVTGANGGLGGEFVRQVLERGAAKVYATARTPRAWDDARVVPLTLDITDEASAEAAATQAADTTVVVNNAGVYPTTPFASATMDELRAVMETNYFGPVTVARAFAPVLAGNGGGAVINVLSVLGWVGGFGGYGASKSALWSATNSLRLELAANGTHVLALQVGPIDTPMLAHRDIPKSDPVEIVRAALDGLERGELEVLADKMSVDVKARLSGPVDALHP